MAEDKNLQVKVDIETEEKFNELYEEFKQREGGTKKDFMSKVITQFQLEKAKFDTPILAADITELQQLTKRIDNIFIGISERVGTMQANHEDEMQKNTFSKDDTIELQQQRITTLNKEKAEDEDRIKLFIADKETAEAKATELQQQLEQSREMNTKNDTIIKQHQKEIGDLTSIVSEYKSAAEENKQLHKQMNESQAEQQNQAKAIEKLQSTIAKLEQDRKDEQEKIKIKLDEALQTQADKLTIKHEKEMLEINKGFQAKTEEQLEKHMASISEYETKVKNLLEKKESKPRTQNNQKQTPQQDNLEKK